MTVARAAGYPTSFSAEISRAIAEADHNLRSVRHAIGNDLHPVTVALELIRRELRHGRRITAEDLEPIEQAVARVVSRLEPPASAPARTPGPAPG
jgi:hypothetical protein